MTFITSMAQWSTRKKPNDFCCFRCVIEQWAKLLRFFCINNYYLPSKYLCELFMFGACIISRLCSMTLNSVGPQSMMSIYDPTDQEHVYNMSHPRRGHFVVINNRYFKPETGHNERRGTDVDAANLFATFKQLGFEVDLKSNLTCHQMLRVAIDCKLL